MFTTKFTAVFALLMIAISLVQGLSSNLDNSNSLKDSQKPSLILNDNTSQDQVAQELSKSKLNMIRHQMFDSMRPSDQDALSSAYLVKYLQEKQHQQENSDLSDSLIDDSNELSELPLDSENSEDMDDDKYIRLINKRSRGGISKKESPSEQRNRDMRRQQAARWDIGFGKRGGNGGHKPKSFIDAMYGKRNSIKFPKLAYGRKQQWDIQYGRK